MSNSGWLLVHAAVAVVGQRAVHPTLLVHVNPLWAVHFGGAQQIAGLASLNQHFTLVGKAVGCGQRTLAVGQGDPLAFAVRVELGHHQRAVVQQTTVGGGATGFDGVAAHKLVDVTLEQLLRHGGD